MATTSPPAGVENLPGNRRPGRGTLTLDGTRFTPEERASAEFLRDEGYTVVLREPESTTRAGGGTSDLKVNDQRWDIYSPQSGTGVQDIVNTMAGKARQVGRHSGGVLVNLRNTRLTPVDVERYIGNQQRRGNNPLRSLRNWVVIKR